ncbi:MAG: hypothetical protein HGB12_15990, partial [Bacteroidetes bacterium]|nr:hypothetical protein [Bacteroidota bacterium]
MNEMLSSVGKEILGKDKKEYEKVIESQLEIMLDFFKEKFSNNIEFESTINYKELNQIDIDKVAKLIYEKALTIKIPEVEKNLKGGEWLKKYHEINTVIINTLQIELLKISDKLIIKKFHFRQLNQDLNQKVLPFIKNKKDEERIIERLKEVIKSNLAELPF